MLALLLGQSVFICCLFTSFLRRVYAVEEATVGGQILRLASVQLEIIGQARSL